MSKRNQSIEPKKPGRKPVDYQVNLKVEFVRIPEDHIEAWKAGIRLLLELMCEARDELESEAMSQNDEK